MIFTRITEGDHSKFQKRAADVENGPVSIDMLLASSLIVVGKRLYTLGSTKTTNLILCAGILPEAAAVSGRYRSLRLVASLVAGALSNRKRFFLPINTDHVFGIHRGTLAL
jgi:hypothetical protein